MTNWLYRLVFMFIAATVYKINQQEQTQKEIKLSWKSVGLLDMPPIFLIWN